METLETPENITATFTNKAFTSFIETQFPVKKVSLESYKERKSGGSQTLTGLGKWWGRKPLVLVRATILGLLMPASDDPVKDREIFLKIMTMDDEGLLQRKNKRLNIAQLYELATARERIKYFTNEGSLQWKTEIEKEYRIKFENKIFLDRLSYEEQLTYCQRPEQIPGPSDESWKEINKHLGTSATTLQELVEQLGVMQFGHRPRVGDAFCGGGSIPFEAARMGCDAYGSDLNPAACLLTWAALNIIGGGEEVQQQVRKAQQEAFDKADAQITEWGIEHNEQGWRADAYLYCIEMKSPATGYWVPLAPSWVISEKYNVCAVLKPDHGNKRYDIEIITGADKAAMEKAKQGTVSESKLICPENTKDRFPIATLRGKDGLRLWENNDIIPRPGDAIQERLYCIRYVETYFELKDDKKIKTLTKAEAEKLKNFDELIDNGKLKQKSRRHYIAPTVSDLQREDKIYKLLKERLSDWQEKGFIPSRKILSGVETDRLFRERGWTHWHHLFNPRQLLINGCFLMQITEKESSINKLVAAGLSIGAAADNLSRLCGWNPHSSKGPGSSRNVFFNQALNTQFNYSCRSLKGLTGFYFTTFENNGNSFKGNTETFDARAVSRVNDLWITDPPYADAVNYHELGDFFVSWHEKIIKKAFPIWYTDSKPALALKGTGSSFNQSMVECYTRLNNNMPDNGAQVVMFTHQDSGVWADLALILWACGLQVTAAWTIQTETESGGIKKGNYVQGTVIMVLRKQKSEEISFLSDIHPDVANEVKRQLDAMRDLDVQLEQSIGTEAAQKLPAETFDDADYQLAAYAAALRVITSYKKIEDIDVQRELARERKKGEENELQKVIDAAVKIAMDYLIPRGIDGNVWRSLTAEERFYLKGLEIQEHGEYRSGVYQEMARGFNIREYRNLLHNDKANITRLKSASEYGNKELGGEGFGNSLLRQVLFAIRETTKKENPLEGRNWLYTELEDYWGNRQKILQLIRYIISKTQTLPDWQKDNNAALLLAGFVENDSGGSI
jgi:putative DNA methylase